MIARAAVNAVRPARRLAALAVVWAAAVLAGATTPASAMSLSDLKGHMSLGYSRLFVQEAPGGSLSVGGGLDLPAGPVRIGVDLGMHLLGSKTATSGSLIANVDYSAFEADLLVHWVPRWNGPVGRLSIGPGLVSARAELSTSGGGAAFTNLAVEETVPAAVVFATLLSRSETSPVRVGLEASFRRAFLEGDDWALGTVRLVFHY